MLAQDSFNVQTTGRGTSDITARVQAAVNESGIANGMCLVFLHHTSASLMLCENADPDVRRDLETWMSRAVPDGDVDFVHIAEGPDDMPAHVRSVLTTNDLSLPVKGGRCDLGSWQGVYVWEHRHAGHARRISLTIIGE